MIFGSPVRGTIHPDSWKRPTGNHDFHVSQRFGCTGYAAEPAFGTCAHFHRGIDLGNQECGADIIAAAAGTVRAARFDGAPLIIWLDHGGGWATHYGHLASLSVREGQSVAKGQLLGHVGSTGASACHLHFAVKSGVTAYVFSRYYDTPGVWHDPWPLLAQNVTIHPKGDGVRIRSALSLDASAIYATTDADGHIRAGATDLGLTTEPRKWGGIVAGPQYTVGGATSDRWELMWLGGAYRYIASLLAVRSAS